MINFHLCGKWPNRNLKKIYKSICTIVYKKLHLNGKLEFDISFISEKKIQQINKKYRKINKPTDIITFANRDNQDILVPLLGEIFISVSYVKKQIKKNNYSLQNQLAFLFIHGILHLFGYDHKTKKTEEKMFKLSYEIMDQLALKK